LAFGKTCSKDGFMFDKPKKNTSCYGKIIKKDKFFATGDIPIGFYQRNFQDENSL
jgi:hypothetical protein